MFSDTICNGKHIITDTQYHQNNACSRCLWTFRSQKHTPSLKVYGKRQVTIKTTLIAIKTSNQHWLQKVYHLAPYREKCIGWPQSNLYNERYFICNLIYITNFLLQEITIFHNLDQTVISPLAETQYEYALFTTMHKMNTMGNSIHLFDPMFHLQIYQICFDLTRNTI